MASVHENAPPRAPEAIREVVEDTVRALFEELHHAAPPVPLDLRSRLDADLGFDSLARVELLERVARALHLEVPDDALASLDTIADLSRLLSTAPKRLDAGGAGGASARVTSALTERLTAPLPSAEPTSAGTLPEVLAWRVATDPGATHAIVLRDGNPEVLSYAALLAGARTIASSIRQLRLSPGATVGLMLPTSVDYLHAFFGVILAGAIPVPLYPPAHRSQLEEHVHRHAEILANAATEVLITFHDVRLLAHLLKARVQGLRHILSVAELAPSALHEPSSSPVCPVCTDSVALLQYTSGSTGSPKGVVLTHAHLLANIRAMGASIGASRQDIFVSWLPLYHDMGLIGAWLGSLYYGCPLVLMPPTAFLARPARWLRTIHDYRGTLSASPNFGYELAARRPTDEELKDIDLSSLRVVFNGAEPVYPETLERFRRRFVPYGFRPEAMTPVYGLAEVAVGVTFPPAARGPHVDRIDREWLVRCGEARPKLERAATESTSDAIAFVSCGRPLPGYRLRIVDEHGLEAPERREGDLQFAGPSATAGYYRNADATARLIQGEWRNTGDRAYLASGELYITGRAKDLIIRRGRHFYPEEIESTVGAIDGVRRGCVAAFGTKEAETGTERLIIVAETREADPARRRELKGRITDWVTSSIGEPPDEIVLSEPHTVLKTSSGKLRRAATREAYVQGALGRARRNPTSQMLRLILEGAAFSSRRGLDEAARVTCGLYAWCVLLLCASLAIVLTLLLRGPDAVWRLNHSMARGVLRLIRVPLDVTREAQVDLRMPHVVVANHSSYADSLFLCALLAERHRFVAKAELAHVPVLGPYLRKLQTIFIDRFVPEQSIAEIGRVQEVLRRGEPVVMFPEGTFTATTGLRAFHLGAFQASVAARVPVIPLALCGTRTVLRDGQRLPRRAPVRAILGTPLLAAGDEASFAAAVRLRDAARAHILRHCGEVDLE